MNNLYKDSIPCGDHFPLETFFQIPDFALKIEVQNCQTKK